MSFRQVVLPPERELAKQLGVSRSSLREALIVLEISGWIIIQSGNGIIVSDNKHSPVDYTIEEILYVRDLVDSHCARLAALANNETIINKIELLHFRMENSIHENNVAEFYMLDKQFHLTISEASHNRVLLDMSRMLWEQRVNIPYAGLINVPAIRMYLSNLINSIKQLLRRFVQEMQTMPCNGHCYI